MDDDETLTAYHEAGHVVVGYLLGARIDEVRLGSMIEDCLPNRFGDCMINWGRINDRCCWQLQREVMTILAGPVAEMIYIAERLHPAHHGPWKSDWQQAAERSAESFSDPEKQTRFLEAVIVTLHEKMSGESFWAAVAAISDELLAHESLEHEQIAETVSYWL
ncbi:hypothetical protein Q31b_09610 [Novipirellula aureliae]|uniref:ATP-dependent zinc metalloprotease FtsH n=1 Tax=Novipirellula aureliae TaxID=2527966 RepID=A0A5C6EB87_9BACT|nr:cell division protein FtsH [Novipirellula aureliae]TWU45785.1 hypothetical protein Q31b_09610 [Novipirellula aureliae]